MIKCESDQSENYLINIYEQKKYTNYVGCDIDCVDVFIFKLDNNEFHLILITI